MKPIKLILLLWISAVLVLTGCPPQDPTEHGGELDIEVTGLAMIDTYVVLTPEESRQLIYVMVPDDANSGLSWNSSNDDVATVSQTGLVTGISTGEVAITLFSTVDPSIYATCHVLVGGSVEPLSDFFLYNQLDSEQPEVVPGTSTVLFGLIDDRIIITNTSSDARLDSDEFEKNTLVLYNTPFTGQFRISARVRRDDDMTPSSAKGITIGAYTESAPGEFNGASSKLSTIMMRTRTDIHAYYSKSSGSNGTGAPHLDQNDPNTLNEYIFEVERTADAYTFRIYNSNTGDLLEEGDNTVENIEFDSAVTGSAPV